MPDDPLQFCLPVRQRDILFVKDDDFPAMQSGSAVGAGRGQGMVFMDSDIGVIRNGPFVGIFISLLRLFVFRLWPEVIVVVPAVLFPPPAENDSLELLGLEPESFK